MSSAFLIPTAHLPPSRSAAPSPTLSRRSALIFCAALLPMPAACAPVRTILDEERELNEKFRLAEEQKRRAALIAAFDAVVKSSAQLEDLQQLVTAQDRKGIDKFARLFNDAVVRNGMVATAKQLPKEVRKEALQVCARTTEALKRIDDGGKDVEAVRMLMEEFDKFRPTME